jgi:hypothetical protein
VLFRERVLFIGTQFSNLYTAVDAPAKTAWFVDSPARGRGVTHT